MNKEINFIDLNEYIYLINIESESKIGLNKISSAEKLLYKFKSAPVLLHKDWQVMDLNSDFKRNAYGMFRIGIYINNTKRSLVVALAGTKNSHDIKPNFEILSGKVPERFKKLDNFLDIYLPKETRDFYQNLGYSFTFTGHSLGGFLAQLSYIKCKLENPTFEAKVVTFDSPGAQKQAIQLLYRKYREENHSSLQSRNLALKLLESPDYKGKILNIVRRFNIINTTGKQIGSYLWLAESYFKIYKPNRFRLFADISYHKLSSFSGAVQNHERYNIYSLDKPIYTEAILLRSATNNFHNILLTIKEIQQSNKSKEIFQNYIFNILKAKYTFVYTSFKFTSEEEQQTQEFNHYLKTLHEHGFEFIDRSNPLIKIVDMIKSLRGKRKSLDKQQDNLLIINNIIQKIQNSELVFTVTDSLPNQNSFIPSTKNPTRKSMQTRD